jgi:hypothetical protein
VLGTRRAILVAVERDVRRVQENYVAPINRGNTALNFTLALKRFQPPKIFKRLLMSKAIRSFSTGVFFTIGHPFILLFGFVMTKRERFAVRRVISSSVCPKCGRSLTIIDIVLGERRTQEVIRSLPNGRERIRMLSDFRSVDAICSACGAELELAGRRGPLILRAT